MITTAQIKEALEHEHKEWTDSHNGAISPDGYKLCRELVADSLGVPLWRVETIQRQIVLGLRLIEGERND